VVVVVTEGAVDEAVVAVDVVVVADVAEDSRCRRRWA
jgi:hypothetical protein